MFFKVKLKNPSLRFDSYFFMGTRITNLIEDVFKLHFWCYCFLGRDTAPCQPHFKATQNATKKTIYSFLIHSAYLCGILYLLSEHMESFIYPISFYGICLVGTSFLSTVLWNEQKDKTNMILMFGLIMVVISWSILAIKLFEGDLNLIQDFFRLFLYVGSELLTCLYFIASKKSKWKPQIFPQRYS